MIALDDFSFIFLMIEREINFYSYSYVSCGISANFVTYYGGAIYNPLYGVQNVRVRSERDKLYTDIMAL